MTVFAHISDLHLGPVPFPAAWPWRLKPVLGWINWARQPGSHDGALVGRAAAAVHAAEPDHVVVTGDLIELGLDREWQAAHAALTRFGAPAQVSWGPGNHDLYTTEASVRSRGAMADWLPPVAATGDLRDHFPRLDLVGDAALVTLCSGKPTWLFSAEGELGAAQLGRLAAVLTGLDRQRFLPVIALHHPPHAPGLSRLKRLRDAPALLDLLARHRCPVVLHGHLHKASRAEWSRDGHTVAMIGAASASATGRHGDDPASFNLVTISRGAEGFDWQVEARLVA
ncbi:metallophosphoesterase family protein [Phreatobacter stygius]|uniref:Metallophosphoesterase n=1 Tax=Phreatobacter stygius TaxID=1940610 RepID=A0A4D7BD25_9HYPH|nr:metallophosphoesterase [Phreatobacter stygius]QCI67898.1 metallophosphoesterase [Phreatobacter stygius]